MKIIKLLGVAGFFVICGNFTSLQAQDNPAQAAAREALLKQMNQLQATESPAVSTRVAPAIPKAPVAPAMSAPTVNSPAIIMRPNPPAMVNIPAPVPITAPAMPISMTKAQRLQTLLMLYKADQITSEQYQKQRAAILAEH